MDFHYSRLKGRNSIRLAVLKPGSRNKGITIDLVDSFVPEPGKRQADQYDALSYTWGQSPQDKTIACNGRRLAVTQTLLDALKHFRRTDREVTLWIDQICICQTRPLERTHQVQMMEKIFRGARKVFVWLGPHDEDSRAGMQLAEQLLHIAQNTRTPHLDRDQLETYGLPARGTRKWKSLAAILRRPWFWRTWIVQEVVLNPNVELILGDSSLRWEDLEAIIDLLEGPSPFQWLSDLTLTAWDLPFSRINRIRRRHQRSDPKAFKMSELSNELSVIDLTTGNIESDSIDLLDLLLISRDLGATDPRDKIYALLGLSTYDAIPDYEASPEQIFNEFALHVIGEVTKQWTANGPGRYDSEDRNVRKALVLLSCAGLPNQSLAIPSWVPDWTMNLQSRPLIFDPRFAAGDNAVEIEWNHETGMLELCGKLVDTIAFAGSVHLAGPTSSDSRALIEQWWQEACQIADMRTVKSPGSTMHLDALKALCRDLSLCEHGYFKSEATSTVPEADPSKQSKRRGSLLDDNDTGEDDSHNAHRTLTLGPTRGRVLCVTTTGYLALVPHGAQEGDLVYVVLGANVPFVFRPVGDGAFALIGEAYVQGIMNGELLAMDQWSPVTDIFVR